MYADSTGLQLYNLKNDMREQLNLAGQPPDFTKKMAARLLA